MSTYDLNEMARMQPRSDKFETEGSLRARERVVVPAPKHDRPHQWVQLNADTYLYTNDGTENQYKAQLCRLEDGRWKAVIRTLGSQPEYFSNPVDARSWVAHEVYRLISEGFTFYGPDKSTEPVGCDA